MSPRLRPYGIAAVLMALLLGLGAFGWPVRPQPAFVLPPYQPPSPLYWLGTDALGREVWPRLLAGWRLSLSMSLAVVAIGGLGGVALGSWSGYRGGRIDLIFQRGVDILMAFPGLLLAIALAALLGPGRFQLAVALSATGWIGFARLARAQALSLRERDFVRAAEGLGYGRLRILIRHLIPNLAAPLLVQASFSIAAVILGESSLSFLGLGIPDAPSLGALIRDGARDMALAPHLALAPGAALTAAVLFFNAAGDALRDAWDVKG